MSFRFEKLTTKAQQAVANAQTMAGGKGHPQITTLHLLGSLLAETDGIVLPLIKTIGAPHKQLSEMVDGEIARLPSASGGSTPAPDAELQKVCLSRPTNPLRRCKTNSSRLNICCLD